MRDEALQSVHHERAIAIAQGAQRGLGGNTLLAAKNAYDRAAAVTTDKMVRLAFELTGNTAEPVCTAVEQGLRGLRDALSNDLAQFFREQASWAPLNATDALGNDFLTAMDRRIEAAVDDLSHGIAGGAKLSKDPLVSVIANIT